DVLRVDRPDRSGRQALPPVDPLCRSRRSIRLNLKDPAGVDVLLRLAHGADVLVEAFRPGAPPPPGFRPGRGPGRDPARRYGRGGAGRASAASLPRTTWTTSPARAGLTGWAGRAAPRSRR